MTRSLYTLMHRRAGPRLSVSAQRERLRKPLAPRLPLATPAVPASCLPELTKQRVAVVGGGFAGLMAARTLCRHGVKVTLFEARAQVGGRVLSATNRSIGTCRVIESGAELIGSIHTYWCRLAIEYGLGLISRCDIDEFAGMQLKVKLTLDKALSMDEIADLAEEMERRVLRPLAQLASTIIDPSQPWMELRLRQYDGMSVAQYLKSQQIAEGSRLWLAMDMLLRNNNVAPLEELNLLGLLCLVRGGQTGTVGDPAMGYWDELEIYRCAEGCQKLALAIAKELEAKQCTLLRRAPVTQIDLAGRKLTYKDPKSGKATQAAFDYVIFAIPPPVWDAVKITPEHPKSSVGLMRSGPAVKFFSILQNRFWIRDAAAPSGGTPELGQIWEGTDNQMLESGGVVLNVFAGAPPKGKARKSVAEFRKELGDLYTKDKSEKALVKHTAPFLVDWEKQPHIKTGYCSPGLNQIFSVGKKLREPFLQRMFFAGEHTQMDHFGYMEGALRSGERAAVQVLQRACGGAAQEPVMTAEHDVEVAP